VKLKQLNIGTYREVVASLTVSGLFLWLLWPILGSAYIADDIPNSQRSAQLAFNSESLIHVVIRAIRQWMHNEGRFFPVAVIENALIFNYIHSRFLYKSLQLVAIVALVGSLVILIHLLTKNLKASLLVIVYFGVALQVRVWYDPTISFGILLPSVGLKAMFAFILVLLGIRSCRKWVANAYFIAACIIWLLALMQYEVVLLLSPIALLIALSEVDCSKLRRLIGVGVICVPSVIYLLASQLIRSGVQPSPAYTTNFDPSAFLPTLKYQVLGAVPLSVPYSHIDSRFGIGEAIANLSIPQIVFCLLAAVCIAYLIITIGHLSKRTTIVIFLCGVVLLLFPAIPTSLSVRWQSEVGKGHAYLPVLLQYLGTSLLLLATTVVLKTLLNRLFSKHRVAKRTMNFLFAMFISSVSIAIINTNRAGITYTNEAFKGYQVDREIFEASVRRGLVPTSWAEGVFLHASFDPALWMNKEYVKWLGGPTLAIFGKPSSMITCRELRDTKCVMDNGGIFILEHTDGGSATAILVDLKRWWARPESSNQVKSVNAIAKVKGDLLCGKLQAQRKNGWWVSTCEVADSNVLEKIKNQYTS
jgi:hypothetical protein